MSEIIVDGEKPKKRTRKTTATRVEITLPPEKAAAARDHRIMSLVRKSTENEIRLTNPSDFFEKMSKPVMSRLYTFVKEVEEKSEEMLDTNGICRILEFDLKTGNSRYVHCSTTAQLKEMIAKSTRQHSAFMKLREAQLMKFYSKEDATGGFGFADDSGSSANHGLEVRGEFTPLIGTPFYKQLYLYDYWEMHSKAFWYSNYSGIAKLIIDMTRNFVMGKGFNVQFEDDECQKIWDSYEERSGIREESRQWCDDITKFGEVMLKGIPDNKTGILWQSFDPSTIWEIVTDPENIKDIKYYHQQYNTQYQMYTAPGAPTSKYIINQLKPNFVIHEKINVTSYEKRGRSDLLAPMLYFKYYEDYMQAKLARAKNEAAFIWDVEIDGSEEDVMSYINNSQNITDVPPGSENVHNKAIKRTPLSPTLGKASTDQISQDILSYVAMAVSIPANYLGTFGTSGSTKAGALVATEPVAKKMQERQSKMEALISRVVKSVLRMNGKDPLNPKYAFEVNFPELLVEDRSTKIKDTILARDSQVISHETASYIIAKELNITKYDYEKEQKKIIEDSKNPLFTPPPPDLTPDDAAGDDKSSRSFDRQQTKKDGHSF